MDRCVCCCMNGCLLHIHELFIACASIRSVYLNIPFLIIMNVLISLIGLIIYAYYADVGCDPVRNNLISNSNQVYCVSIRSDAVTCLLPLPKMEVMFLFVSVYLSK